MNETELRWSHVGSVFWLVLWRTLAGVLVMQGIVAILVPIEFGFLQEEKVGFAVVIGLNILLLVWTVIVIRQALRKRYSQFRLAVIAQPAAPDAQ